MTSKYSIVTSDLTVKALQDSGYKSTAHAIAELIDNGIEAGADLVELFVVEGTYRPSERARHRVETIAVIDNGHGMDGETLRQSLRFGAGTRQHRRGIGRFGVGLPNSSISQCDRVDVWSWTNGPDNALHTHLDLAELRAGLEEVPEPKHEPVPEEWHRLSHALGPTGTLVQWTQLERVQWRGAEATLANTESLIGRIYRRLITKGTRIRLVPVRGWFPLAGERDARPNDPLYLTAPSSTPFPFDAKPMFRPHGGGNSGEIGVERFMVKGHDGADHPVLVRASIAVDAARRPDISGEEWPREVSPTLNPGDTPWGKHAAKNLGISLIRADRELDLDTGWTNSYDPVERWWGVEIDFPPQLDEVFGVTNNKQAATIFSSLSSFNWRDEAAGLSFEEFRDQLREEGDSRLSLIEIVYYIREKLLGNLRTNLTDQTRGTRSNRKRHEEVEAKAEHVLRRRKEETQPSLTDVLADQATVEERQQQQFESLVKVHKYSPTDAERIIAETTANDRHIQLLTSRNPDSPAFFNVEFIPGMLQVSLNMDHPAYSDLIAVLDQDLDSASKEELAERLVTAANAFKLLLLSWARYEDEQPDKPRARAKQMRQDWGRIAREFLSPDDEDDE
ncbi:ATP-binding protein [Streptantibioticus ferralitis]|uniref:ATP-binding protein n=1 Tax=Streptantibioticus ferralitis TaxID=236510 RepID=A0ABT5YRV7_9ACTN|nr:ATP-binding protein [Streptantibioticus ferralitis]MDF2254320.1 ATP-binding protein [Streptantibioticus ferralitis]